MGGGVGARAPRRATPQDKTKLTETKMHTDAEKVSDVKAAAVKAVSGGGGSRM